MTKEEILNILREAGDYVSGEFLAEKLGVSRAAVWKHIHTLIKEGYAVDVAQGKGYRLMSVPDKLYPAEIRHGLQTKLLGRKVIHLNVTGSTNTVARQVAERGVEEGTVVLAETQSHGKGRLGRKWVAKPGSLAMSVILKPAIDPMHASSITLMAAVSVTKALRGAGLEAAIKWPNDVLVNGKKICGILTEMSAETDIVNFIILGIGVNVNNDVPLETATTMKAELSREVDRVKFTQLLLEMLEEDYLTFKEEGFTPILWSWRRYSDTLGRLVEVTYQDEVVTGVAQDVDEDGSLLVKTADGSIRKIVSGDCKHLRGARKL
ncbi:biotin operon repressor/biotin--[acetyl-CoA-carboxylase] synthetase [Methanocella paludicola SANAE]|uniref:Biotin operon repressor/biotin--[acetyl-CoA-carboxylase] synthetase n=1 Tax=Methanocella paludicola (strain DSM 17711 / JCM 13418 / NBRC 101707 / SANAE) TaxID=304371 RepID=D1YVH8_METPS|nr:biotin--[acetyl-CoA-carboxylase] ligase [Methanocella paludicola]BAI60450.1 biotin operon repressor/biotin--[acetyl-CoA-carboxylase] synthetase [Methanocella paludicola SANAE]